MPVPIYLEWEIKFNEKYLKGSLHQFVPFALFWDICVKNKVKVTVNQLRSLAAGKPHPHPDDRAVALGLRQSSRGDLYVYLDAPDEPGDDQIPVEIAVYYAMLKTKELGGKGIIKGRESGGMTFEQIRAEFLDLFQMAKIESFDQLKAAFPAEFPQ